MWPDLTTGKYLTLSFEIDDQILNFLTFSGGVFSNSDLSVVPLVRKADIMIMKNKQDYDELETLR